MMNESDTSRSRITNFSCAMCEYLLRVNPDDDFVRGIAEAIRRDPEHYPTKRQAHWISIKHDLAARKREERHQPVRPHLKLIVKD